MQKRWFWFLRKELSKTKFRIKRFCWGRKKEIRNTQIGASIVTKILRETWSIILVSILMVACCEALRASYADFPTIADNLKNTYDVFLGTIAGVAGIFLGLYFTAISVVAGAIFPKVPASVRAIILNNKVTNLYVHCLALLTAVSVLFLGARILGMPPNFGGAIVVILLSCFGIFSFVELGFGVFNLFDPSSAAKLIIRDIEHNIRSVTVEGFAWEDTSFQVHYQKQSKIGLDALNALVEVCRGQEQLAREPLMEITNACIRLLHLYQSLKRMIPTKSYWFELMPKHKSWFIADFTEMKIAMRSQTSMQPEMIPNRFWFEQTMFDLIGKVVQFLLEVKNAHAVYEIMGSAIIPLRSLSSNLNVTESLSFLELTFHPLDSWLDSQINDIEGKELHDAVKIGLLDLKAHGFICILLDFLGFVSDTPASSISHIVDRLDWQKRKSIYTNLLPISLLEELESLFDKLSFEREIEGCLTTPKWFYRQMIFRQYADSIKVSLDSSANSLNHIFTVTAEKFIKQNKYIYAAHNILRGLEVCHKFQYYIEKVRHRVTEIEENRLLIEFPWPEWDWDNLTTKINTTRSTLIDLLATHLSKLSTTKPHELLPDYFGQAYHSIISACYAMLINHDVLGFDKTFKQLLFCSFTASEQLRKKLAGQEPEIYATFISEPLLDMLELSGYAIIYSELHQKADIWNTCKETWNNFLESKKESKKLIELLVAVYTHKHQLHRIAPRDTLRFNWKRQLQDELRNAGMPAEPISYRDEQTIKHSSTLIRAIGSAFFTERLIASQTFIVTYLLKRKEAEDVSFRDVVGLQRLIDQELEKEVKKQNGDSVNEKS
jgi:hypothetical protein